MYLASDGHDTDRHKLSTFSKLWIGIQEEYGTWYVSDALIHWHCARYIFNHGHSPLLGVCYEFLIIAPVGGVNSVYI